MLRIRSLHDVSSPSDRQAFEYVTDIYQKAFPYYPEYAAKISKLLHKKSQLEFEIILLVAENAKQRVMGFGLTFYFQELRLAYLDYIASDIKRPSRGVGNALYETMREVLINKQCKGLLMDVPPDEPELLKEKQNLGINQKRMAFYENYDVRPIVNTLYEHLDTLANGGYPTYLLWDALDTNKPLSRKNLKKFLPKLLNVKAGIQPDDPRLKKILKSIVDDPVQVRHPRYGQAATEPRIDSHDLFHIDLINGGDAHQIHHLKEKGYVEKPARISSILKGLNRLPIQTHAVRSFSVEHIRAVHDGKLIQFLQEAEAHLKPGKLLYPNIFPIRKPDKIPQVWEMRAGYYCIDTFTPVTNNVYKAAKQASDAALTGARLIKSQASRLAYVLCRPPGHHAEHKAFGGFCYFNSAAIAAHYLSKVQAKVAFLDIDYHHGNGSQDIFYQRDDVYFISIHGDPRQAYPYFAGYADETGEGNGKGFNRNYPLPPNTNDDQYLAALEDALKRLRRYQPWVLVLSLGFDIMRGDPTGTFLITPKGMYEIASRIAGLGIPLLVVQEGGYSLRNLNNGAQKFFQGLLSQASSSVNLIAR